MAIKLLTGTGPFNITLKHTCFGIVFIYLCLTIFSSFLTDYLDPLGIADFYFYIITGLILLLGTVVKNYNILYVWLIFACLYFFIYWPLAFSWLTHNFDLYAELFGSKSTYTFMVVELVKLLILIYCTRFVYCYYIQLRDLKRKTATSVYPQEENIHLETR